MHVSATGVHDLVHRAVYRLQRTRDRCAALEASLPSPASDLAGDLGRRATQSLRDLRSWSKRHAGAHLVGVRAPSPELAPLRLPWLDATCEELLEVARHEDRQLEILVDRVHAAARATSPGDGRELRALYLRHRQALERTLARIFHTNESKESNHS